MSTLPQEETTQQLVFKSFGDDAMAPNAEDAVFVPPSNNNTHPNSFGGGLNGSTHSSTAPIGANLSSPSKAPLLESGPIGNTNGSEVNHHHAFRDLLGSGVADKLLEGKEDNGAAAGGKITDEEEVIEVVPPGSSEAPPGTFSPLGGDMPLEGLKGPKGNRRNSDVNSLSGSEANSLASTSSSWMPIPEAICVYHQRGSCLRLNCRFFHGTQEQLKNLQELGASHYRFDGNNKVEVPAEGEDPLANSTSSGGGLSQSNDPAVGVRFADANVAKGKKKPIVCLAYLSGTCRRPDCRFTHLPPNVRPLPATSCAYFAVGTCKRNTCRYFHGSEDQLAKLKSQGATMYNPLTNEPYEKIPDFEEPPNRVGSRSDGAGSSGRGSPQVNSSNSPFVVSQAPPPYQGGAMQPGGTVLVQTPPGAAGLVPPSPQQVGVQVGGVPQVSLMQPPVTTTAPTPGLAVATAAPLQSPQPVMNQQPIHMAAQQQPQQLYVQSTHGLIPLAPGQQAPPGAQVVSLPAQNQQPAVAPQQHSMVQQQPFAQASTPGMMIPQQQQQPMTMIGGQPQIQQQPTTGAPIPPTMMMMPQTTPQLLQQQQQQHTGQILQATGQKLQPVGTGYQQPQPPQPPATGPKLMMMPDGTLRSM